MNQTIRIPQVRAEAILSHKPEPLFHFLLQHFLASIGSDDQRAEKAINFIWDHYTKNKKIEDNIFNGWRPEEKDQFFRIWQLVPMLMQTAADQSLRNAVYSEKAKSDEPLMYSVEGAVGTEDLNTKTLEELENLYTKTVTVTLTRHPTNNFDPLVYQKHAFLRRAVHDLALAAFSDTEVNTAGFEFIGAMYEYSAAYAKYAGTKKHPLDEGREVITQFENTYNGMGLVTNRMLKQLDSVDNDTKWFELMTMTSQKWRPIRLTTWAGPDQDNNFNAKEQYIDQLFRESVAALKPLYITSYGKIRRKLIEAGYETPPLLFTAFVANDNGDDGKILNQVAKAKATLDHYIGLICQSRPAAGSPERGLLSEIYEMRINLNCFEDHPFDLDFRQDIKVTSDICNTLVGQQPDEESRIKALVAMLNGLDGAQGDPRQRVDALQEKIEGELAGNSEDSHLGQMLETVKTLRLMQDYPTCGRQYTLSSFGKASHWLEMQLLLKLGGLDDKGVVPLSESDESLLGIGGILHRLAQEPQFNDKLKKLNCVLNMMQAKSDPTRECGAYIVGSQTEWLIQLVDFIYDNNAAIMDPSKFLKAVLYVGGSLDNNRSMFNPAHIQHDLFRAILYVAKKKDLTPAEAARFGEMFAPDFQFTIQGRDADLCFGTERAAADMVAKSYASSVHFQRGLADMAQIIEQEFQKWPDIVENIDDFIAASHVRKASYQQFFFEKLLDDLGDIFPKQLRKEANISSRVAGRGSDNLTASRAIDLQGVFHVCGIHVNEWLGAELDTPEAARKRFISCPEERRQVMSAMIGLARCDFDGAFDLVGGRPAPNLAQEATQRLNAFAKGNYTDLATALESVDIDPETAILCWLESRYKTAKINVLCAIGLTADQAAKWDFENGLPFDHPINDELKLLNSGARANRQLLRIVKNDEGFIEHIGGKHAVVPHALDGYRGGLAYAITPPSATTNAPIAELHVLTRNLAWKAKDTLKFAA